MSFLGAGLGRCAKIADGTMILGELGQKGTLTLLMFKNVDAPNLW